MAAPTRLLVSVVRPDEVEAALAGGADVVDVKNPAEGALGAPSVETLRAVRALVPRDRLLSVALGDAPHLPGTFGLAAAGAAACGADIVKVGLLGSIRAEEATLLLRAVVEAARGARVVGVAYADAVRTGGLPPHELPRVVAAAGAHGAMLDTFAKDGTTTFAVLGAPAVALFVHEARSHRLEVALAGALQVAELGWAAELGVDFVGVRGAACSGGRDGRIDAGRVRILREALAATTAASPAPARR